MVLICLYFCLTCTLRCLVADAGSRQSSDRSSLGLDQSQGPKQGQVSLTRTSSDALTGNVGAFPPPPPPPPPAFNVAHGADYSPPSGGRSGKGGTQAAPASSTKTIQSYFFKSPNGSAVQNLASSYGAGDVADPSRAASGLPTDVDLGGADGEHGHGGLGYAEPMARVGRSGSTGELAGGGRGDGGPLHRRLSHAALPIGDHSTVQSPQGQWHAPSRGQAAGLAGTEAASVVGDYGAQAGREQQNIERLGARLSDAEALAARLRKELDRANLERGSMETMVRLCFRGGCNAALIVSPCCFLRFLFVGIMGYWHRMDALMAFVPCTLQADTLQKQLDSKIEEFKTKELDREAQQKQLTSVVEGLLRKVCRRCDMAVLCDACLTP